MKLGNNCYATSSSRYAYLTTFGVCYLVLACLTWTRFNWKLMSFLMGIESFDVVIDSFDSFKPGQTVRGAVIVNNRKRVNFSGNHIVRSFLVDNLFTWFDSPEFYVEANGGAFVSWSRDSRDGSDQYGARETYLDLKIPLTGSRVRGWINSHFFKSRKLIWFTYHTRWTIARTTPISIFFYVTNVHSAVLRRK